MQRQGQVASPTPCRGHCPQTISRQTAGVLLIAGMQYLRVPYNNAEYEKEEDDRSSYERSKLDKEDNAFGDFQKNNYDSDEDEDGNSGDDNICLKTLCGRILTMILSYQKYQITTVVHMVLRKVWRSSIKLFLNELCLPVVCIWNTSAG